MICSCWRAVSSGGGGADAWYVFEPARPRPVRAPLAIVMHGYYEFAGYDQMYELIRHTVRQGSFSFGGIITANLANRWRSLHLPRPRAIFLDDPHDGGLITGSDEPALDDSLAGIPSTTACSSATRARRA